MKAIKISRTKFYYSYRTRHLRIHPFMKSSLARLQKMHKWMEMFYQKKSYLKIKLFLEKKRMREIKKYFLIKQFKK
jgi:hypothetical protein